MAFNGSLISLGGENFPLGYVYKDSYKVTPNRRQDLDSGRNANGVLIRNVLDHTASTISFTVKPMYNTDLANMMAFIRSHYINEKEKKINIRYYCPDLDDYKEGQFYVPDIEYPMMQVDVDKKRIRYGTFTLEFIEY